MPPLIQGQNAPPQCFESKIILTSKQYQTIDEFKIVHWQTDVFYENFETFYEVSKAEYYIKSNFIECITYLQYNIYFGNWQCYRIIKMSVLSSLFSPTQTCKFFGRLQSYPFIARWKKSGKRNKIVRPYLQEKTK